MTPLLCPNHVVTSFCRNNDAIIAFCFRWDTPYGVVGAKIKSSNTIISTGTASVMVLIQNILLNEVIKTDFELHRVTHICVSKLTNIGSDNGFSPGRHQAMIWTNAGILLMEPLGTNEIYTFSFKKMHLKMPSGKSRPFCLVLKVLIHFSRQNRQQFRS